MSLVSHAPTLRRGRFSTTLSAYIARQFFFWVMTFFLGLIAIIFLVTLIDLLDRVATKDVPITLTLELAF